MREKNLRKPEQLEFSYNRPLTKEEYDDYVNWEDSRLTSISNHIVEYFPQVMMFHTIIVASCALRAPTSFALACTVFAMLMRMLTVFGYYWNKKSIYVTTGSLEVLMNFMILFIQLVYGQT